MEHFTKLKHNPLQLEQINLGLANNLDVSMYNNSEFSWEHMEAIRLLMQDGIDPTPLLRPDLEDEEIAEITRKLYEDDLVGR